MSDDPLKDETQRTSEQHRQTSSIKGKEMEAELNNKCPDRLHSYVPIIEGAQTVGLVCMLCGKTVREDMEQSGVVVTENKILFPPTFFEEVKNQSTRDYKVIYHRKDPRF